MKHTRVPRTVRRDIWRLAMETLSIPSLHIFWSRIRNQIKSRIENRKKTNGPNRKSNRLKYQKKPRTLCHIGLLLGLIDVVQCLLKLRTLVSYKQSVTIRRNSMRRFCYFRPNRPALCKLCTSINQPYLIWAAVLCRHVPQPKDQGDWDPQSKKRRKYRKKRSCRSPWWREVVQWWSSAGQLNFNYSILVAVLTNVGLCDRDSNNFRFTVTKNFYEKLKRVEGGGKRPLRISTLVKTAH